MPFVFDRAGDEAGVMNMCGVVEGTAGAPTCRTRVGWRHDALCQARKRGPNWLLHTLVWTDLQCSTVVQHRAMARTRFSPIAGEDTTRRGQGTCYRFLLSSTVV